MNRPTRLHLLCARWSMLAIAAALPAVALGNVYPTGLSQSANSFGTGQSVTLGYLLNEDATGVSVSILNSSNAVVRTISPGAQTKGLQSVMWDGKDNSAVQLPAGNYSFRVTSTGAAKSAWTLFSTDSTLNNFELPRGVAVNKNPTSPFYGRVYVTNSRERPTAAGRAMGDGMYMLNADLSDTGVAGGTGPHMGGVDWTIDGDASGVGPFRLEVGPDSSVYITDWSDPHAGLWTADPNLTAAIPTLDNTNQDGLGLNATHGSISDVYIRGVGANRQIFTADEDFAPAGSILRYDIGTAPTFGTMQEPPSGTLYDNSLNGNWNINFFNSLAVDNTGSFWYSQNRSAGTDNASLVQIDPGTGLIIWDSLAVLGSPDPLRGTQGIAYDPVNNVLALVTNTNATGGNIIIFDPVAKAILTQFGFGNTTNTDVAFDNAGNLYVANRSGERVRTWSPPNGTGSFVANQFATDSLAALGSIILTAGDNANFDSTPVSPRVDGRDFLIWQRGFGTTSGATQATGDANGNGAINTADYDIWKAQLGTIPAVAAAGAIPEPAAGALAMLAAIAFAARGRRQ